MGTGILAGLDWRREDSVLAYFWHGSDRHCRPVPQQQDKENDISSTFSANEGARATDHDMRPPLHFERGYLEKRVTSCHVEMHFLSFLRFCKSY